MIFELIPVAVAIFALWILLWRFLRGNEEMEPGGSWGLQFFGRRKAKKPRVIETMPIAPNAVNDRDSNAENREEEPNHAEPGND